MSKSYDNYLEKHIDSVEKAYEWLRGNLPDVIDPIKRVPSIGLHDSSKYEIKEYDAYDRYFYGNNCSFKVVNDFRIAWLHHIHNNPHHWQHWVLINDDPEEGTIALEMDYGYVIEMICDWWSFSWTKGNLYEIFEWYEKKKDYMILHKNTRKLVEDILKKIREKLDREDN